MLYEPSVNDLGLFVRLADSLGGGAVQAGVSFAVDFVSGQDKPWQFYGGVGVGAAAAVATGTPLAAATMYVVGEVLRVNVLKSPDGSEVDIFLDGVAHSTVTTYALDQIWETVAIMVDPGSIHRVDFVNMAVGAAPWAWMALSAPFEVEGPDNPRIVRASQVTSKPWRAEFTVRDGKRRTSKTSLYYPGSVDYAAVEAYCNALATTLTSGVEPVITGGIESFNIARDIAVLPGVKTSPTPAADAQEKMNFTFAVGDENGGSATTRLAVPTWADAHTVVDLEREERYMRDNVQTQRLLSLLIDGLGDIRPCDQRGWRLLYPKKHSMRWFE